MIHTAYLVNAIHRLTGRLVARGVFSEPGPTLANAAHFTTHPILQACSRRSYGRAERLLLKEAARRGIQVPKQNGWDPSPSTWAGR